MSREVLARLEESVERFARLKAALRLEHAVDYLIFSGSQWQRGNDALATQDALAILRNRIADLHSMRERK